MFGAPKRDVALVGSGCSLEIIQDSSMGHSSRNYSGAVPCLKIIYIVNHIIVTPEKMVKDDKRRFAKYSQIMTNLQKRG
jgi:hypothetical protein